MRKTWSVCTYLTHQYLLTWRSFALCILILMFVYSFINPFRIIAINEELLFSPVAFPILMSDHILHLALSVGSIVIFSGAPFSTTSFTLVYHRAGFRNVIAGKVAFIFIISTSYVTFINFASNLCLLQVITWHGGWDAGWKALLNMDMMSNYWRVFDVNPILFEMYTPTMAQISSSLLEWCNLSFIGLLIYIGNRLSGRSLGTLLAIFFMALDMGLQSTMPSWCAKVSPLTLANPIAFHEYNGMFNISIGYSAIFFLVSIPLLVCFVCLSEVLYIEKRGAIE